MNKKIAILIFVILFLTNKAAAETLIYHRDLSVNYAARWDGKEVPQGYLYDPNNPYYNPKYRCFNKNNYEKYQIGFWVKCEEGSDCANFGSQCLIEGFGGNPFGGIQAGGIIEIGKDSNIYGNVRARDWIDILTNYFCFKDIGNDLGHAKKGDIVLFTNFAGSLVGWMVHTGILNENNFVAAHSNDRSFQIDHMTPIDFGFYNLMEIRDTSQFFKKF